MALPLSPEFEKEEFMLAGVPGYRHSEGGLSLDVWLAFMVHGKQKS